MDVQVRRGVPGPLQMFAAVLALACATSCTTTDKLRISARNPVGANFVYLIAHDKPILEGEETSDAVMALITPARIRDYTVYVQFSPTDLNPTTWKVDDFRSVTGGATKELEDGERTLVVDIGAKLADLPGASMALVLECDNVWRIRAFDARDFQRSHTRKVDVINGSVVLVED